MITDEFIISFIEWYDINYWVYNTWDNTKTTKELLEIYRRLTDES